MAGTRGSKGGKRKRKETDRDSGVVRGLEAEKRMRNVKSFNEF